jgi:hypothetical protein
MWLRETHVCEKHVNLIFCEARASRFLAKMKQKREATEAAKAVTAAAAAAVAECEAAKPLEALLGRTQQGAGSSARCAPFICWPWGSA